MKPKIGDFIIVAVILICSTLIFGAYIKPVGSNDKLIAVITQNGNIIKQINLNEITEQSIINIDDDTAKIIAENGKIRFAAASCPDKVCINTGWLSKSGQSAVCLPNRLIIKLEGQKSDIDIVLG